MKKIHFRIREVHQSTGAFEHVVRYEAEVELTTKSTEVAVELLDLSSACPNPSPVDVQSALEHIRRGIVAVLFPQGLGARVRVVDLYVHPIDFVPRMYEKYTQAKLQTTLQDTA